MPNFIKKEDIKKTESPVFGAFGCFLNYSHSIVAGGLPVIS